MTPEKRSFRVRGLRLEAEGVLAVELEPADGGTVPDWEPGAHIDLEVGDGTARQFSLCGDIGGRALRVAVLREPLGKGGSAWVHDTLRPGAEVLVGGPRNHFRLDPSPAYLFVAGGIGITPLLPMLDEASRRGARWVLHYFGRSRSSMAFVDELARFGDRVCLHPADEGARPVAEDLLADLADGTLVYACGPQRMLEAMQKAAADVGHQDLLRSELFSAPTSDDPAAPGDAFDVHLRSSGRDLHVPADRSILSVLQDAGIDVVSDCEEGICGSCETRVVEGVVDHRDHVLTRQEREANDCLMVCVSRARSPRLTLDL